MSEEEKVVHEFNSQVIEERGLKGITNKWSIAFIGSMIVFGVFTGYGLAVRSATQVTGEENGEGLIVQGEKVVGSQDKQTFKDNAEGVLEKGGVNGEGTHHLVREGGPSRTAYLTSSIVDLDDFIGKKVRVWGETFGAEKAGWLMDVGRVEVLE